MKGIFLLDEIVACAKKRSPFYGELYQNISSDSFNLSELPIVEQNNFWNMNSWKKNSLLTGAIDDGIIFKSGGTTGRAKFSVYSKEEWETFTECFGHGMDSAGFQKGDRVGNLFYAGELYSSFIFIMKSMEKARTPIVQFPITGMTTIQEMLKIIMDFDINVLAGVPTSFMNMAAEIRANNRGPQIDRIFFGGESLYDDQLSILEKTFEGVQISSIGYASVDGGHLGYFDVNNCSNGEHVVFSDSSVMEIVDDDGHLILETGKTGRLVYTNLTRKLMPIIRYPVGDLAVWTDVQNGMGRRFLLKGRSEVGARIGPVTINRDDVATIISIFKFGNIIQNFQIVIDRNNKKDRLTLRFAVDDEKLEFMNEKVDEFIQLFLVEREAFKSSVKKGLIEPLNIELVSSDNLIKNERTGKLRFVIDRR